MGRANRLLPLLVLFLAVGPNGPAVSTACPLRWPEVLAVGGGDAWVRHGRGIAVFSLRDGPLRRTLQTDLAIMEVHFDPRGREFWGTAWKERPLLWTWSETGGFQTTPVPARLVFASYQAENGKRLIAATLSTAGTSEEIAAAYVALGTWRDGTVRFTRRAPPPSLFRPGERFVGGETALFGYLIHTARGEAVPATDASADACYVRVPGADRWLAGDRATLRLKSGPVGTDRWTAAGELPAPRAGLQFRLAGLFADPHRSGQIVALIDVDGIDGRRVAVSISRDAGQSWGALLEVPAAAIFPPRFDEEGIGIQTQHPPGTEDAWVVGMTLVRPDGGRGRTIRLRLPAEPGATVRR
jgi:hypothetical protein